jgi:hypothetical protein
MFCNAIEISLSIDSVLDISEGDITVVDFVKLNEMRVSWMLFYPFQQLLARACRELLDGYHNWRNNHDFFLGLVLVFLFNLHFRKRRGDRFAHR